jgi:hypothetical protein
VNGQLHCSTAACSTAACLRCSVPAGALQTTADKVQHICHACECSGPTSCDCHIVRLTCCLLQAIAAALAVGGEPANATATALAAAAASGGCPAVAQALARKLTSSWQGTCWSVGRGLNTCCRRLQQQLTMCGTYDPPLQCFWQCPCTVLVTTASFLVLNITCQQAARHHLSG